MKKIKKIQSEVGKIVEYLSPKEVLSGEMVDYKLLDPFLKPNGVVRVIKKPLSFAVDIIC